MSEVAGCRSFSRRDNSITSRRLLHFGRGRTQSRGGIGGRGTLASWRTSRLTDWSRQPSPRWDSSSARSWGAVSGAIGYRPFLIASGLTFTVTVKQTGTGTSSTGRRYELPLRNRISYGLVQRRYRRCQLHLPKCPDIRDSPARIDQYLANPDTTASRLLRNRRPAVHDESSTVAASSLPFEAVRVS